MKTKEEKIIYNRIMDEIKKYRFNMTAESIATIIAKKLLLDLGYVKQKKIKINKIKDIKEL